jgi:hypothetical protein
MHAFANLVASFPGIHSAFITWELEPGDKASNLVDVFC